MRILYQHRSLGDGAEGIHIQEMIEAFRSLGHDVIVHAVVGTAGRRQGRGGLLGWIKLNLPQAVLEAGALVFNILEYVAFRRTLYCYRPDLVYKRHAIHDVGVVAAARHAGVPLILEVNLLYSSAQCQRYEPSCFPTLVRLCERMSVESATLVAVVSTPLEAMVRALAEQRARVVVVPNGANPLRFGSAALPPRNIRRRCGLPPDAIVAGWAGIIREWHAVDLLLEALMKVPGLPLLIIGDGPDRPRLEGLIGRLGLTDRVVITGRVPHPEMPHYIAEIDIGVVADDRTGVASPMKLLEYMAMGRAVVAPKLRNIADIVDDERDGLLFVPGDATSLALSLGRLVTDPELRARLSQAARLKIERQRNWRRNAEVLLAELTRKVPTPVSSAAVETREAPRGARA